ncbi:MAG: PAS domain S-box protein [Mongoliibacter sp.]|uniref:ATP-binding protein n=1 Tax=Mongoliibacter sp. TaxID=2022438 RepID=UPI0012F292F8|nr:ATP-binding protein [Mongoliibacter sp.]TVP52669.1 MAG: PAS domain S-box protein [Mongoliibacter sp.]
MANSEAILKAIGESYFILQSKKKIKEAIPSILSVLGKATQVDRVYIFQNFLGNGQEIHFSQKFEWVADGVSPQIDFEELQNVPWSVFPIVAERLGNNTIINEVLNEESNGKEFYDTMTAQGILSFLFIPIMVDNVFWGFMGFDNCSSKEIYSDEQAAALHAFASTLGYTILANKQKKSIFEAKESYSYLINNVHEVIFRLDINHRLTFINQQWERFTKNQVSETLGKSFESTFKKPYRNKITSQLERLSKGLEHEVIFEAELLDAFADASWVKVQAKSQNTRSTEIFEGITGSIINITREKEVLAKLEESVAEKNAIINSVKDILYTFSGDLKNVLFVSDNLELFGIEKKKYVEIKDYWLQIIHPEDKELVDNELKKLFQIGVFDAVYRIKNEVGKIIWVQNKAWAVKNKDGKFIKIHGRYTDVTELKTKELKLKSSEDSLQKLNDLLQAVNDTQLSYNLEDDFRSPLDTLLIKILGITGSKFGFIGEVLYDENDSPYLKTHTITNISWSEETEKFYQNNFRVGIEFRNLNTLFGESLKTGKLVISNEPQKDTRATGTPHGHPPLNKYMGVPVYKGEEFLGLMGFANKETDYTEADLNLLRPLISGYANLIKSIRIQRQKKEADKLRIQADEKYKLLSQNTGDIIALHGLDLRFEYVSPSIEKVLGFIPEDCIGKTPAELFKVKQLKDSLAQSTGNTITVMVHHHKITKAPVILETLITPLKNMDDVVYSYMATSRDVTERELVLDELKESLAREQELSQLKSRFISMTSHEFRTPLATIMSSTEILEMLLEQLDNPALKEKTNTHLDRINNQIKRLTGVISNLLVLEKSSQDKIIVIKEEISIKHFLKSLIENNYRENELKVELILPEKDLLLKIDTSLFSHIMNNLIDNAIKYSKNSEKSPEIRLEYQTNTFSIIVKDFGIGIPKEDQKYIFGSFFRAKNVNTIKGTGLGLNIVKEFVEKLDGQISFKSIENEGTEFIVNLPHEN